MKYWFYAIVLANVIFFLWEFQGNPLSQSDSKNTIENAKKQILLLSELEERTTLAVEEGTETEYEEGREQATLAERNEGQPAVMVPNSFAPRNEQVLLHQASEPLVIAEAASSALGMPLSDDLPDEQAPDESDEFVMPAASDGESSTDTAPSIKMTTASIDASDQQNTQVDGKELAMAVAVSSAVEASTPTPTQQIDGNAIEQTSVSDVFPAVDGSSETITQAAPLSMMQGPSAASSMEIKPLGDAAEPSAVSDISEFEEEVEKKQDNGFVERQQASDTANVSDKTVTSQKSSSLAAVAEQGDATLEREVLSASSQQESIPQVCYEVGPFTSKRRLNAWITKRQIDRQRIETVYRQQQMVYAYLVYYPAGESFAESRRNETMLKEKGVEDLWLFRRGDMKGIISLGLFRDKFRAENLLRQLADIDVKAEIKERYQDKQVVYARLRQPVAYDQEKPLTVTECMKSSPATD